MEDLEKQKLQLEILRLKLPWYKSIEFWKIIIPTMAVILSLYFTFGQGILDTRKEKLELQKEQLKLEIIQFQQTKAELKNSILFSSKELDSIKTVIVNYKEREKQLSNKIKRYEANIIEYKNDINRISLTLAKDKKYYQNELLNQFKLEKKHLSEISNLKNTYISMYDTLAALKIENKYLKQKAKFEENDLFQLEILKHDAMIKKNMERLEIIKKNEEEIEKKYQAEIASIDTLSLEDLIKKYELLKLKLLNK